VAEDTKPDIPKGFLDKVLEAIPNWAMGFLGILLGFSMCFIAVVNLADLKAPFNKYVDAEVARITKAVDSLEAVTFKLDTVVQRVNSLEARVTALEKHKAEIDARYHK
jgi:hypothetical protein